MSRLRTIVLTATIHAMSSKLLYLIEVNDFVSEIMDAKYMMLRKLGWGHFSCVWLALKL